MFGETRPESEFLIDDTTKDILTLINNTNVNQRWNQRSAAFLRISWNLFLHDLETLHQLKAVTTEWSPVPAGDPEA